MAGDKGIDTSRIHSKETVTKYHEEALFSPIGPVNNGPQKLYGLRYSMTAYPLDSDEAFLKSWVIGYGTKEHGQVLRSFMVPRGVAVNAGGSADVGSKSFRLIR